MIFRRSCFVLIAAVLTSPFGGCGSAPTGRTVTRAELGAEWPFDIDQGEVSCSGVSLYFTGAGKRYAINGNALMTGDAPDIRESSFWTPNPAIPGTKKSLFPIIQRAKETCGP